MNGQKFPMIGQMGISHRKLVGEAILSQGTRTFW